MPKHPEFDALTHEASDAPERDTPTDEPTPDVVRKPYAKPSFVVASFRRFFMVCSNNSNSCAGGPFVKPPNNAKACS